MTRTFRKLFVNSSTPRGAEHDAGWEIRSPRAISTRPSREGWNGYFDGLTLDGDLYYFSSTFNLFLYSGHFSA